MDADARLRPSAITRSEEMPNGERQNRYPSTAAEATYIFEPDLEVGVEDRDKWRGSLARYGEIAICELSSEARS
jgi:hypothetical protein